MAGIFAGIGRNLQESQEFAGMSGICRNVRRGAHLVHGRQSSEIPHKEIDKDTDPLKGQVSKFIILGVGNILL